MKSLRNRIVVIGTGAVGASFAYAALLKGLSHELVLIDANHQLAEGHALDLNHGMPLASPMKIWAGDYSDCADANIIVIAAGAAQKPGETRLDLVKKNAAIFKQIVCKIKEHTKTAIILVATNPVDVLSYLTMRYSGYPANRVIGSGTVLDTARFRYLIAQHLLQLDPRSVHGYIIGEHGDSEVPVWSLANVGGVSLDDLLISEQGREEIVEETRTAAYRIIEAKGATYYAIAMALARICEAILRDERSVLPVSTLLEGYHGISDIFMGVPSIVGHDGVQETLPLRLTPDEEEQLRASAKVLREITDMVLQEEPCS